LGESLIISLAGAAIGIVGSIVITFLLTQLPEVRGFMQPDIAPAIIAQGFMMAVIVGLVGGVYPAWLASQLVPDQGLRHD
jgi:putative ABC transport system permease protein